ncbi:MAG TPA: lantibiotic dehydratase, partial [Ktedonobacteraceae bacterium]|nr:lantibiotic dehydratase [Ktedonobacteraceae bacterium]
LHTRIGAIAAQAAELLLRLTPLPEGSPSLKEYRRRFLEKYGENAEVPVFELLSPEAGLGAPAGYTQPSAPPSSQPLPYETRHRRLQALVQDALNSHSLEVELTQAHLTALQTWHANLEQLPRSLEIYLQVGATSREALDQGKFFAVVSPNPGSPQGGRTFGRFFDLLGEPGRNALQSLLTQEETLEPEMLFAELSYQHARARSSNVAIRPGLRSYEIAVGTTSSVPAERVIALSDLVAGVHRDRFYLRSLRHHKKVMICQLHMLNIQHAPTICRFLIEAASDGLPALSRFDWGHLSSAPFLPRITVTEGQQAKLILAPACWNLEATTIHPQGEGSTQACWFAGLHHWRTQWRVPRYVYLTQADHRLLLDLEHPLMAAELLEALRSLKEGQQVMLQEVLPDFEHLWLTDTQGASYFAEIVVPLLRQDALALKRPIVHQDDETSSSSTTQIDGKSPCSHVVPQPVRVFSPGSAWNYVKLYCNTAQQEEIIAGPLRDFVRHLREQDLIDRWFFLRYADPEPHLRLRIHTPENEQIQPALALLLSWGRMLTTQGRIQRFSLDTYEREVARYGGIAAIDLLEQIFSLDSDVCSSLVAAHSTHHLTLDPLAIAVCSLDSFFSAWNYDTQHRLHWLQKRTEKYAWSAEFRRERKRYCALLAPWIEPVDPELLTQRTLLNTLLVPLKVHLPPLVAQVRDLVHKGQFWVAEEDLLASLAHMHKIRILGLGANREQQLYAFWHHTLESISHRLTYKKSILMEQ